jgi:hypothetical protein
MLLNAVCYHRIQTIPPIIHQSALGFCIHWLGQCIQTVIQQFKGLSDQKLISGAVHIGLS